MSKVRSISMLAPITAFMCLLGMTVVATAPAFSGELGRTVAGTIASGPLSANFKRGSKFTLTEPGTVTTLSAYLDGNGGGTGPQQRIRLALYQNAGGLPGVKVAETTSILLFPGASPQWWTFPVPEVPLNPGTYWIVIHSGDTTGIVRDFYDGPANWYGNADAFADGASAPFGTGAAGTGTLSVYATYVSRSEIAQAGRTSIAATPSSGLSANFKRGSKVTLSQTGRLSAFAAYLDAKGGTAGSQLLRMALYRDAGGLPGTRVAQSGAFSLSAGTSAGWVSVEAPPVILAPGSYWMSIHSGTQAGLVRDFGDGAANWYGNADAFSDGSSTPFGSGSAGTGTLSAFASYLPGPFITNQIGRTSIASAASKGLSANYARGSLFFVPDPAEPGTVALSALYAYLDGKGGASGSQKLRMVVYTVFQEQLGFKLIESDVVTIAAGTPPGWVRFTIVPVILPGDLFRIVLQSGDTGGVVRDYGDSLGFGQQNWLGAPDTFSDGAADRFAEDGNLAGGDVTLSVYGAYTLPQR